MSTPIIIPRPMVTPIRSHQGAEPRHAHPQAQVDQLWSALVLVAALIGCALWVRWS